VGVDARERERSQQAVEEAKALIRAVLETNSVQRVSLSAGKLKIELERAFGKGQAVVVEGGSPAQTVAEEAPPQTRQKVPSPLVGTFSSREKPGGKPLIEAGMHVQRGQTIGIIDVLGIKNPVRSEVAGLVEEILVHDGQRVQFDQPLLVIDTAAS